MENVALAASAITKSFAGFRAVDDVSVSIAPGAVVGLIGANGAGKTTFVNIVTGYLKPDSGTIRCGEVDITGFMPRRIRQLGVSRSFQIPQVFLDLTVFENVSVALHVAGIKHGRMLHPLRNATDPETAEKVGAVLERFSLTRFRAHRVREVPGGIRKLLDVAMATVDHPRVLLLDEPTSGVAVAEKFAFMDLVMAALADERAAVLFVEHDMEILRRYAQRTIVFHEGRVMRDGAVSTVLADEDVRRFVTGTGARTSTSTSTSTSK